MDIDGKKIASAIRLELKNRIEKEKMDISLAFVLVGNDIPSQAYVKMKEKACSEVGIRSIKIELDETIEETKLLEVIEKLNQDPKVDGILVQMPLPKQINEKNIVMKILPSKDVDGFHPVNVGKVMIGDETGVIPCTPFGIIRLLQAYKIETSGKNVVVIGRSNIVGRPIANLLSQKCEYGNATVTIAHSKTKNLTDLTKKADIIIAAIGSSCFLKKEMVKQGVICIDVGINRVDSKIVGDIDYEEVSKIASYITPVPGGVGPMTIAMLLENTYLLSITNKKS
jgi:methylenetetrahydrofolate dehydrogenase (NADP+)/methenyltetrahydrofolate cyclohydrolase